MTRRHVDDPKSTGAESSVIHGDVCSMGNAQKAGDGTNSPIGGVVQATMGLNVGLFLCLQSQRANIL